MRLSAIFLSILLVSTSPSSSQNISDSTYLANDTWYGMIQNVKIEVNDQVDGNCWTNADLISSKTRLTFEQNNVSVLNYEPADYGIFTPRVFISALGNRISSNLCSGSFSFIVDFWDYKTFGGAEGKKVFSYPIRVVMFKRSGIVYGPTMNDFIQQNIESAASDLVSNILSARRDPNIIELKRLYPQMLGKPLSKKEWEKYLETINQ